MIGVRGEDLGRLELTHPMSLAEVQVHLDAHHASRRLR